MTVTEKERQKIIAEEQVQAEERRKRELSDRMRLLGKSRSPKKLRAVKKNIKKALAVKWGKKFPEPS